MDLGWARYAASPVGLLVAGSVAAVALHQVPGVEAVVDRATERRPQSYLEASFVDPMSLCDPVPDPARDPDREQVRVTVRLRAVGGSHEVTWRISTSATPGDVARGRTELERGETRQVVAQVLLERRGVSTIRFVTADGEHDLHFRCGSARDEP